MATKTVKVKRYPPVPMPKPDMTEEEWMALIDQTLVNIIDVIRDITRTLNRLNDRLERSANGARNGQKTRRKARK